ncbi:hypothetical protein MTO96_037630 [Rhipicephalus appendiculatus]
MDGHDYGQLIVTLKIHASEIATESSKLYVQSEYEVLDVGAGCFLFSLQSTQFQIKKQELEVIEARVDFNVTTQDDVTSLILKVALGEALVEDPSIEFFPNCLVLEATPECLLVSYGRSNEGKHKCLLWGLSGENVNTTTKCYEKLQTVCAEDTYDMTEKGSPCERNEEQENEDNMLKI